MSAFVEAFSPKGKLSSETPGKLQRYLDAYAGVDTRPRRRVGHHAWQLIGEPTRGQLAIIGLGNAILTALLIIPNPGLAALTSITSASAFAALARQGR